MLSWEDICYMVRVGGARQLRQILSDVSGIAGAPGGTGGGDAARPAANGGINGDSHSSVAYAGNSGSDGGGRPKGGGSGGGMCAILGPSGAGKTTLLDILAGRRYGAGEIRRCANTLSWKMQRCKPANLLTSRLGMTLTSQ